MADKDRLGKYESKRDTSRSGEPSGADGPSTGSSEPVFVCQRHAATRLHFDFRLEVDGVLVSWAVPKGPSTDPRDKRLAVRTEDHPMDYAAFEGRIPKDDYGGGTVIVWDAGVYENRTTHDDEPVPIADAIERGHLVVDVRGHKIAGRYALTHTRMGGDEDNWLMVKVDDEYADRRRKPTRTQLESVLSGRTNDDL